MISFKDRKFQVWGYSVSHQSLLIRSPGKGEQKNIDMKFVGVEILDVSTDIGFVHGIEIKDISEYREFQLIDLGDSMLNCYIICGDSRDSHVVALAMEIEENDFDLFESFLNRQDM